MRRPIASKSERSGTGVDIANLSKAVCHGESDKCRFGNPPQESNFQRLGISPNSDCRGSAYLGVPAAVLIVARRTVDEVKLRGPQLPAQTANSPVRCASAPPRPSRAGRDLALAPQRVGQPIQTVADDAVDTFTPAAARSSAHWPATVLAMS